MRRHFLRMLGIGAAILVLVLQLGGHRAAVARAELPQRLPDGARSDRLLVEPDAGMAPIYGLLGSARRSLDLAMYELADPTAEAELAEAAARGVTVRVILDGRLERAHNAAAYAFLASRGVRVVWSSPRFFASHEKAFVIDRRTAVVMSLNFTARYYATSRDAAVIDADAADVAAIESVFDADFAGRATGTPAADDLVWSPRQSAADFLALIRDARRSVAVESEELTSRDVVAGLVAAARRGVMVSVAMTYDDAAAPALSSLTAAGARVSVLFGETPLYIHAKLLAIDVGLPGERAFVGSENLADSSLWHDRELGVVLMEPQLVRQVAATIDTDLRSGRPFR
jgi:cardiolipin synthase